MQDDYQRTYYAENKSRISAKRRELYCARKIENPQERNEEIRRIKQKYKTPKQKRIQEQLKSGMTRNQIDYYNRKVKALVEAGVFPTEDDATKHVTEHPNEPMTKRCNVDCFNCPYADCIAPDTMALTKWEAEALEGHRGKEM